MFKYLKLQSKMTDQEKLEAADKILAGSRIKLTPVPLSDFCTRDGYVPIKNDEDKGDND